MKRLLVAYRGALGVGFCALLAVLLAGSDAAAFLVTTTRQGKELKWAVPRVGVYINAAGGPAGANDAILASLATWTDVFSSSFEFAFLGATTSTDFANDDGVNTVGFGPISLQGVLALNTYWYNASTGELRDSDIKFNTDARWSTSGMSNAYDLQNVATHELGHTLSLANLYGPSDAEKTMYGYAFERETIKRTLDPDDIAGISYLYPAPVAVPVTGDIDGDGKADLGRYTADLGEWVWLRTTLGRFENIFGYAGTVPVTGNFDDDPLTDFGVYYAPLGSWYLFKSSEGFFETQFGYAGTVPVTGDFDGDGRSDFGAYYAPLGKWYLFMSSEGFFETQFGYAGTVPVTGDFDGDDRTDFGVYYAPMGKWYLFMSTEGFYETQFGYAGTVPVTGDFDGDGWTDFGVYYAPLGKWYLFKSTEGFSEMQFGYVGTVPVTGDFDGDGRTDFGVYDPATGDWYLYKSTEGFAQINF